jgi:hypothetical protein
MRSEQGDVYEKIIQEVVDASKNDFEESGVGQGTLNELQQVSDDTFINPFASPRRPRIVVRKTNG